MNELESLKVQLIAVKKIVIESVNDDNKMFIDGQLYGLDVAYKLIEKMENEKWKKKVKLKVLLQEFQQN